MLFLKILIISQIIVVLRELFKMKSIVSVLFLFVVSLSTLAKANSSFFETEIDRSDRQAVLARASMIVQARLDYNEKLAGMCVIAAKKPTEREEIENTEQAKKELSEVFGSEAFQDYIYKKSIIDEDIDRFKAFANLFKTAQIVLGIGKKELLEDTIFLINERLMVFLAEERNLFKQREKISRKAGRNNRQQYVAPANELNEFIFISEVNDLVSGILSGGARVFNDYAKVEVKHSAEGYTNNLNLDRFASHDMYDDIEKREKRLQHEYLGQTRTSVDRFDYTIVEQLSELCELSSEARLAYNDNIMNVSSCMKDIPGGSLSKDLVRIRKICNAVAKVFAKLKDIETFEEWAFEKRVEIEKAKKEAAWKKKEEERAERESIRKAEREIKKEKRALLAKKSLWDKMMEERELKKQTVSSTTTTTTTTTVNPAFTEGRVEISAASKQAGAEIDDANSLTSRLDKFRNEAATFIKAKTLKYREGVALIESLGGRIVTKGKTAGSARFIVFEASEHFGNVDALALFHEPHQKDTTCRRNVWWRSTFNEVLTSAGFYSP
mgnify:FL=1|jgi:hypothetical protein